MINYTESSVSGQESFKAEDIPLPEEKFSFDGKFSINAFYKLKAVNDLVSDGTHLYRFDENQGMWHQMIKRDAITFLFGCIEDDKRSLTSVKSVENTYELLLLDPTHRINFQKHYVKCLRIINVKNGVVSIKDKRLKSHNRLYYFDYCLDFNYLPNADINDARAFKKFVKTSLNGSEDAIQLILEIIGYVLSSLCGAEKMFILIGPSNCGKSVLIDFVHSIIGDAYVKAFPLHSIGDKRALAELQHTRANLVREMAVGTLKNTTVLKQIISNEVVVGEEKYTDPVSFKVYTKLLAASNSMPQLAEGEEANQAILNRIQIVRFPHSIPDSEKDLELSKKLSAERDIIASAAINTLWDLQERNFQFHCDPLSEAYMSAYADYAHSLKNFVEDCLDINPDNRIHTSKLLSAYKEYCILNGYDPITDKREISNYIAAISGVKRIKFRSNGSNPLCGFVGIGIKLHKE